MTDGKREDILTVLRREGIREELLRGVEEFRREYSVDEADRERIPHPEYMYYGKKVWEQALAAILAGRNLLLAGPKATGKNVLAENLAAAFLRPVWNVSFHIGTDASYLIGTDTYDGRRVIFREGPVLLTAIKGGFGVLDEINMAKNEALAVLHAALDFRRVLDVPGYARVELKPETRFIATMNYGYAGTRELNEALTSRFAVLDMPVISEEDLMKLIRGRFPDMKEKICSQFVLLYLEISKKAEHAEISERALDLRGLLDALMLIRQGLTSGEALDMCIVNKSFDSYERGLIRDCVLARIPDDLTKEVVFRG